MVSCLNQWSSSYGQGNTLGSLTPALQSCVIGLDDAYSVGGGSGTPTAGNWLFVSVSWTQDPAVANVCIGVSDDIHSWWRQYPAAGSGGIVRTSISYTPNLARIPSYVYVAPGGPVSAITVLVTEFSGLGPWDTVVGTDANYASGVTTLALSQAAGASSTLFLGAVGGNNSVVNTLFSQQGGGALSGSTGAYTFGVQFSVLESGAELGGIWCYSPSGVAALPATIALYNVSGSALITSQAASWSGAAGSGWVYAPFSSPPSLSTGVNYIACIFRTSGSTWFSSTTSYWISGPAGGGITAGILSAPGNLNSVNGQGLYHSGAALACPTTSAVGTNYWIDPVVVSSQSFSGSGWTGLYSPSQAGGGGGNTLSSAFYVSSSNQSVSGNTSGPASLAGFVLAVLVTGTSPIPSSQNPNWPYTKFEAAFGAGYNTPDSERIWTDLSSRLWHYDETTGIQYQLGELQATNLNLELDNNDAALSPDNTGSPYYSSALNPNMSFQSGVSPWIPGNNAVLAWSSAYAYASVPTAVAVYSLQVTPDGVTANPGAESAQVPVTAEIAYSASAWFYIPAGYSSAQVNIMWFNSASTFLSTSSSSLQSVPAGTWTQVIQLGVTAPVNAAFATVVPQLNGTPSSSLVFYLAEAALVQGTSAVTAGAVSAGTPVRLRAALGTMGGVAYDRWYMIQRNMAACSEEITDELRRYAPVTGSDLWAAMTTTPPTFYRGEVYQDDPYAWWPCNDSPLEGGVLPTALLNAATGNSNPLLITPSSSGVSSTGPYTANGTSITESQVYLPSLALYEVQAYPGWMYGDPQSDAPSLATGNSVSAEPGSAAWQQVSGTGTNGTNGWSLTCTDPDFPALSGGITLEGWFNAGFNGSSVAYPAGSPTTSVAGQPYGFIYLMTLATGTEPVCVLYLNALGELELSTYSGSTPTGALLYGISDLRSEAWFSVQITLTQTTWSVSLNGGAVTASGTATGMTSAWTQLWLNGYDGEFSGNVAYSHIAVYPAILPAWRQLAHYSAAITGFGCLPAPTGLAISQLDSTPTLAPDGSAGGGGSSGLSTSFPYQGQYGSTYSSGADHASAYTFSAVAVATAGGYYSGPSARVTQVGYGQPSGYAVWVSWTSLAPAVKVYTSASVATEAGAAVVAGSGDSFASGYGSSAAGFGVCQILAGDGTSPPAAPSALGDTVGQRIERLLYYGSTTYPGRSIDPAPLLVQAPGDSGGGLQTGENVQAVQQSDSGLLFIDNCGNLVYWQRPHLAGQYTSPVWALGPNTSLGQIPYYREVRWVSDPQYIWNAIQIVPFSPSGENLSLITPANASAVNASQSRYGAQPLQVQSLLQSQSEMQNQANWLFSNYGHPVRHAEQVKISASAYPAAWELFLGINIGDVVTMADWAIADTGTTYTFRVTSIRRRITYGARDEDIEATVELVLSFEPETYWT